jgi:hypothetical protein
VFCKSPQKRIPIYFIWPRASQTSWTQNFFFFFFLCQPVPCLYFFYTSFFFPFFFFFQHWSLNSGPTPLATSPAFFWCVCDGYFREFREIFAWPGWRQTMILLISASWVYKITGVSHSAQLMLTFLETRTGMEGQEELRSLFSSKDTVSYGIMAHACL